MFISQLALSHVIIVSMSCHHFSFKIIVMINDKEEDTMIKPEETATVEATI